MKARFDWVAQRVRKGREGNVAWLAGKRIVVVGYTMIAPEGRVARRGAILRRAAQGPDEL
ncbi:hypothetical protein FA227_03605 [Pseudomonas aeruginosa]|nr:hypothetical protein F7O94_05380 [Pseudomonas aeruginosa]MCO3059067.1 hypothetical protein [Pseudomonas aeruginosa]MCO3127841.1 hypothetical protein [Pseudomonas aeruginosa]MCO3157800.1 hypothetical protein [Pseudomonas aeruginosa]